ncbi:MAG: hypothetical protein WC679_00525 [Bacteroidales bacterium]|jgi:hypothetical protein
MKYILRKLYTDEFGSRHDSFITESEDEEKLKLVAEQLNLLRDEKNTNKSNLDYIEFYVHKNFILDSDEYSIDEIDLLVKRIYGYDNSHGIW